MTKAKARKVFEEKCRRGLHPLIEIMSTDDSSAVCYLELVVRWCPICGSIVVDREMDGRRVGVSIKMKRPAILQPETEKGGAA